MNFTKKETKMKSFLKLAACALLLGQLAYADFTQNQKVRTSFDILNDLGSRKLLNLKDTSEIRGIMVIPEVVSGGLIVTTHTGDGIFVGRNDENEWSSPIFINFKGGGIGLQGGYKSTDLVVLFKSRRSYAGLINGKGQIDLSADAVVLAAGEKAGVMSDLPEITAWATLRGKSRGLFAGVSVNTSLVVVDKQATYDYYDRMYDMEDIYNNSPKDSRYTKTLKEVLNKYFK